jgi:transposase
MSGLMEDAAMSQKTEYKWFERYHGGAESTEDEQRSGHPSTSTADENVLIINKMILANK